MQESAPIQVLTVVQASYDFHNERFLCRCQSRPASSHVHDEYVPLDELRTFCAARQETNNLVDEGVTLQEWMQQQKPAGINAMMSAVLNNRLIC